MGTDIGLLTVVLSLFYFLPVGLGLLLAVQALVKIFEWLTGRFN